MTVSKITLLAAVSLLILILGMPNIEESRQEVRNAQAFMLAQQIKSGALPPDTVDPWGSKFDIRHTSVEETVVTSWGSNKSSRAGDYDWDDISTSMSKPPHVRTGTRKRIQVFAALALSISPWLMSLALIARGRLVHSQVAEALP